MATIRSFTTTHLYDVPFWTMGATMPEVSEPLDGEAWHCCSRPMALRVDRCMAPRDVLVTSSKLDYTCDAVSWVWITPMLVANGVHYFLA